MRQGQDPATFNEGIMSKKFFAAFIAVLLLCAICVTIVACDDDSEPLPDPDRDEGSVSEPEPIDPAFLYERFEPSAMSSYSLTFTQLGYPRHGNKHYWRDGMITGNGVQGAVIAGSPYADTLIFQNIHLILPNKNPRSNDAFDTADELETVRQNIVAGKDITDDQPYLDVYAYHPAATLRIVREEKQYSNYMRYTDYRSERVGVRYTDEDGEWERQTFTSFADDVTITKISSSSTGAPVDVTLSYDNLSSYPVGDSGSANAGARLDLTYGKSSPDDGEYMYFVARYQDGEGYEDSELKDGGYATVSYVIAEGGTREVVSKAAPDEDMYVASDDFDLVIEGASNVYVITVSDRTYTLEGDVASPENTNLAADLASRVKAVADKYTDDGGFDYYAALTAHAQIYTPQYETVAFSIGGDDDIPNEELIPSDLEGLLGGDDIDASLAQKAYYSGRYAQICSSTGAAPRLYGMWIGEWSPDWGSKYTMDANVNLQVAALNTSNIAEAPIGYANFILRQADDWESNAMATHGYEDAIQAPVNSDGDMALMSESCYPYPFRYWNAGASWLLQPLYEALQSWGDISVPVSEEFDLQDLRSVLSTTATDLTDAQIAAIKAKGYLDLRTEILYPLLLKNFNYWKQLLTPEYYTDARGYIRYEAGKTSLGAGETYCIIPSYSPENTPKNYPSPAAANSAVDIAACRSAIEMLKDVALSIDPSVDTSEWDAMTQKLPRLLTEDGALKEWACYDFEENNEHRHLSHLYCAWPLDMTKDDPALRDAALKAVEIRAAENEASHALVHRALIGAKLEDAAIVTDALADLMNSRIYYDSLMTNHHTSRSSGYCTDYAIGYVGIINESLVFSEPGAVQLLPALPLKSFDEGSISGLRLRSQAVLEDMTWSVFKGTVTATIRSEKAQTIKVTCALSNQSETLTFAKAGTKTVTFAIAR